MLYRIEKQQITTRDHRNRVRRPDVGIPDLLEQWRGAFPAGDVRTERLFFGRGHGNNLGVVVWIAKEKPTGNYVLYGRRL